MSKQHVKFYQKMTRIVFIRGWFNCIGFLKRISVALRRFSKPTPHVVTTDEQARTYVKAQTMLSAQNFMIAAKSIGLDTSPMEGFDEKRLKHLLAIPKSMSVPLIISLGYASEDGRGKSVRIPVVEKIKRNIFTVPW